MSLTPLVMELPAMRQHCMIYILMEQGGQLYLLFRFQQAEVAPNEGQHAVVLLHVTLTSCCQELQVLEHDFQLVCIAQE